MTEKIKTVLNEKPWEVLITALLTVIIFGLGWFLVKITNVQEQQAIMMDTHDDGIRLLMSTARRDKDTGTEDKADMGQWMYPTRGTVKNLAK